MSSASRASRSPATRRSASASRSPSSARPSRRSRSARRSRRARSSRGRASTASTRATRSGATTPGSTTSCSSRSTGRSATALADVDRPRRRCCAEVSPTLGAGADLREVEAGSARGPRPDARPAGARASRRASARAAAAAPRGARERDRAPLHRARRPQLRHRHGLLPARQLHDEAQPARQRAGRLAARLPRPPSAAGGRGRAGRARADVGAAADPRRGRRPARGHAAARGRARRASSPA